MCGDVRAETLWWTWRRRIITDYLLRAGETVVQILARNKERASLTAAARQTTNEEIVYIPGPGTRGDDPRRALISHD
jgi:hypothetical protein